MILGYRVYTKYLDIKSSSTCQLKCKHCVMGKSLSGKKTDWDKIRKLLKDNPQITEIHLGGGEPLVTEDNAKDIYSIMKEFPSIFFKITTNLCYEMTPYREKVMMSVGSLQTSFDIGVRFGNIHNLLLWKRNAEYITKKRTDVDVFCCITNRLAVDRIPKLIHMFSKIGFCGYKFIPICNAGSARDNDTMPTKQHILDIIKRAVECDSSYSNQTIDLINDNMFMNCHYGRECTPIDSDGNIKNCGIIEKENDHCDNDANCYMCENFNDCGGRCVLIPCYYDKELWTEIKKLKAK